MYEVSFHTIDPRKTFQENKRILGLFNNLEELRKNYLNFFDDEFYPISDWEVFDFNNCIAIFEREKEAILATNEVAKNALFMKNVGDRSLVPDVLPPMLLMVEVIE
ncbi:MULTISPECIES: hypothetical protein [unclassified Flavobacterium]|uniref:hypothetical protein n=1 Tax=unclassified Flavobacterium TaxID=196869 RepID=UPI00086F8801|nr:MULTISPECIES: hypothetical protein [unclassified Flavobacterium]MBN9285547.1 hypothetical protein [Flavobacterium sp.]ODS81472.1 MAG: hypothetical protein ABS44_19235 [Chryseobacterium sp. SCN 40-13]OJV71094.1 MAG: hypothetical protein BGO42_04575 [Flavobacterium sp. 40-81]